MPRTAIYQTATVVYNEQTKLSWPVLSCCVVMLYNVSGPPYTYYIYKIYLTARDAGNNHIVILKFKQLILIANEAICLAVAVSNIVTEITSRTTPYLDLSVSPSLLPVELVHMFCMWKRCWGDLVFNGQRLGHLKDRRNLFSNNIHIPAQIISFVLVSHSEPFQW